MTYGGYGGGQPDPFGPDPLPRSARQPGIPPLADTDAQGVLHTGASSSIDDLSSWSEHGAQLNPRLSSVLAADDRVQADRCR
jgi:hypothetical protein